MKSSVFIFNPYRFSKIMYTVDTPKLGKVY